MIYENMYNLLQSVQKHVRAILDLTHKLLLLFDIVKNHKTENGEGDSVSVTEFY